MNYCNSLYRYFRRRTNSVLVGSKESDRVFIGGDYPIVVQSMITADTQDTQEAVRQSRSLADAGAQLVRITAPTKRDAENLKNIVKDLRAHGCKVPIVADIHFKPEAAMIAADHVEKIRINPGNYADSKKLQLKEYTAEEYAAALSRVRERFTPLVKKCKELNRVLRIGANHGSLSDRVMSRYGDTIEGMVASVLEYTEVTRASGFHDIVYSLKASSPKVTVQAYRLLASRLRSLGEDWNYPFHLGVTEAGEGEDGRIKSAIGIGALLVDGLGDTIRVSLSEDSVYEIPVCKQIISAVSDIVSDPDYQPNSDWDKLPAPFDPFNYSRLQTSEVQLIKDIACGGNNPIRVIISRKQLANFKSETLKHEGIFEDLPIVEVDPTKELPLLPPKTIVTVRDNLPIPVVYAFRLLTARLKSQKLRNPILLKDTLKPNVSYLDREKAFITSSIILGSLLIDGIGDAILVRNLSEPDSAIELAFSILQASGCRPFKAEYISCPGCGRTLFDLQSVISKIKAKTSHLKGVKIAIMGCIVNGPGEMADADFGYVGGAPGKVNLYVGKTPVKFNIPESEAVEHLIELIKANGRWIDP